jgi:ParB family chromosome partitioning protein
MSQRMVYFLRTHEDHSDDLIKIGETRDIQRRFADHSREGSRGQQLTFLVGVLGNGTDEKMIHAYFSKDRDVREEYFRASEELTDYIRWLRNGWWVILDRDDEFPQGAETVGFDQWRPQEERRVGLPSQPTPSLFEHQDLLTFPEPTMTTDDYYTPEFIIDRVHAFMGDIDLDPASHPVANRSVRARQFFTKADNGLTKPWGGRVWLNPPFSHYRDWTAKIHRELDRGKIDELCLWSQTNQLTARHFQSLLRYASAMVIIRGRFSHSGHGAKKNPKNGHCLFYFGERPGEFAKHFSDLGLLFYPEAHHV